MQSARGTKHGFSRERTPKGPGPEHSPGAAPRHAGIRYSAARRRA